MQNRNKLKVSQQTKLSPTLKHSAMGMGLALVVCFIMLFLVDLSSSKKVMASEKINPMEQQSSITK